MHCTNCGQQIPDTASICPNCGRPVQRFAAQSPAGAAPATPAGAAPVQNYLVPAILATTRGDEESRAAALKAGASAYLTKPFSPDALGREVRKLLAGGDGLTVSA